MEKNLTADQKAMVKQLTAFAEQHLAPLDHQIDQTGEFSQAAYDLLIQQNIPQLGLAKPYGAGLSTKSRALVLSIIARASASLAVVLEGLWKAAEQIDHYGTPEQKKQYLTRGHDQLMGFAITEPSGGSLRGVQTLAAKTETGWTLNGEKAFVTNGGQAGTYVVLTREENGEFATFIIDADMPGVTITAKQTTMGLRGVSVAGIHMQDVQVTAANMLGRPGQGLDIARRNQAIARIFMGAIAAGVMEHALDCVKMYAAKREVVDGTLNTIPAVQTKVAQMTIQKRAGELLAFDAADQVDQHVDFEAAATMAKLYGGQHGFDVTNQAIQIVGGLAYTHEFPLEQLLRDVRALDLAEGSAEWLLQDLGAIELGVADHQNMVDNRPVPMAKRIAVSDLHRIVKQLHLTEDVPVNVGNVKTAKRIIALGRGALDPAVVLQAQQLAKWIGATIAVTRPLTTLEQFSVDQQIGLSGATVTPEVIITIGISGADQFVIGMVGAEHIVAVNQDETAPIFKVAQHAFVGQAIDFLTGMLSALN
ncbi:acyl-CoA dehydrogenase family protein [Lactiplantibacillus mudanjiangensis]|uniref:Acyl-CoA dehydrogenase [Lactobacillus sp.] n=1 Tax=Lactiplantibacillus mudanjiangensis TaxID=1296538 RepID=A0A660E1H1_9LACO|nr:acyl-CoA dehydrogenase family protein [Lactiplantibacillus mudanjiangensis]VDG21214.1 acyl-CoA dehydrogenase [Lactobacillus sp.] [Lactiplantibacillus mudanjiangensis]VDG22838.1 acyl-CoA dehydrogenase [Lactobacillus sp.] [Lactiplantibacillus mudanjiangensis]VDG26590.1 acyl-CoA dehydrogenase [Lactobacillus sp.] [Lactiplantibacillus mudanjiangensis]